MSKLAHLVCAVLAAATIVLVTSSVAAQQSEGQATYSIKATPKTIAWGYYDASTPPALRVRSGDTVEIQTLFGGVSPEQLEAAGLPPDQVQRSLRDIYKEVTNKGPGGHILTGPIYVEEAKSGDVL
jgi:acetamidase/formamidase